MTATNHLADALLLLSEGNKDGAAEFLNRLARDIDHGHMPNVSEAIEAAGVR